MKKFSVLITSLCLILILSGCTTNNTDNNSKKGSQSSDIKKSSSISSVTSENSEIDYTKILINTMKSKNTFITEEGKSELLSNFNIPDLAERYTFVPLKYTFIDFENDQTKELVVLDKDENFYQIFRYDSKRNEVYGYSLGVRSLESIKEDGSFIQSSGANINSIDKISFKDNKISFIESAYMNGVDNKYTIDGSESDKSAVQKYFDDFNKKTDCTWKSI